MKEPSGVTLACAFLLEMMWSITDPLDWENDIYVVTPSGNGALDIEERRSFVSRSDTLRLKSPPIIVGGLSYLIPEVSFKVGIHFQYCCPKCPFTGFLVFIGPVY